ncbi:LysM peptidoglycan-binding domain-containing protein [Streptomyces sp. ISL-98]|uniref:LysM peptidoglycan-binding domain-containing protein n=1 Tax=Streptomyces sp. ISL-98 TaxID=2819192 RepID=UPI001BE68BA1|nr:LysM peptidoglycan-binding domain-containing protein [Streptomyces sp. ISL-98]MBT2510533.1 LysM peptidoglycan-binding domain-containing protein [Streptomyces sp. ISL-98]
MPAKGKHRRPKTSPLTRGVVAAGTGGAVLALPVIGAATAHAAEKAAPAASVQKAVAPATAIAAKDGTPKIYTVIVGDSLSKVADKHSVSGGWKKLYEDNKKAVGDDPRLIHPGLKLTIGEKAEARSADRADRSERKSTPPSKAGAAAAKPATYTNDLDGWIKESLAVMAKHGIPGTYDGIHRNIMRESSGNPLAINNWDSNAVAGTPSKGLLQVIDPTFRAYHVPGTSLDSYDPVANITAACNYAADRYGSIDMVNGPY